MTGSRSIRQGILVAVVAAVSAFAAFTVATSAASTDAAWVVTRTLNVTATAVTPAPPTGFACTGGGIGGNVVFTWTAPAGTAPSGYTLKWTGGSQSFASSPASIPAPFLGTRTYTVYSDYGTSWQSVAGTPARTVNSLAGIWTCG